MSSVECSRPAVIVMLFVLWYVVKKWSDNQKQNEAQIEGAAVINKWEEIRGRSTQIPAGSCELRDSAL